ncbi:MAG: aminoacyl--tRNA ligase-related protein [Candidatus Magasanikbacteria bacterium]
MRQSKLFTKTMKETPAGEVSRNAQLLIQAGFVHKEMAGVYSFLPLGLLVLGKINAIIREEINGIGGQELFLTSLQEKEIWEKTGRWSDDVVDNWFKTRLKNNTEVGLGFTHEEPLARLMKQHIKSYKDLPQYVYQIQTKFRNEKRAKSGIMRSREFLMKDLYSFNADEESLNTFYEKAKDAYVRIFERSGLGEKTYVTFASGGTFSKYSHEFQTVSDAGEDTIYIDEKKKVAVNKEVLNDEVLADLGLRREELREEKAIEVGNIFKQKVKFSEPLGLTFVDQSGVEKPVIMGAYGIGPGRIMGTVVELYNDERGILWPRSIAPFDIHLVSLCREEGHIQKAEALYQELLAAGLEILFDDRPDIRPGEKFADSDLIGIPQRVIISPKSLESNTVEIKERASGEVKHVAFGSCVHNLGGER